MNRPNVTTVLWTVGTAALWTLILTLAFFAL